MSARRRGLIAWLSLMVLLAACDPSERPDSASWLSRWDAIVTVVPEQSLLGEPPDQPLCQDTLAALRESRDDLLPSPSLTVDDLVNEWVAVAEASFFDCPPDGADIGSFDEAYEEMRRIEESVDTALTSEG